MTRSTIKLFLGLTVVIGVSVAGRALAQCQYEVTAVIDSPSCPPPLGSGPLVAQAINSKGHVTGWYGNCITLLEEGFLWTPEGGLITLPRPAGVVQMMPEDINDSGVMGTMHQSRLLGPQAFTLQRALLPRSNIHRTIRHRAPCRR